MKFPPLHCHLLITTNQGGLFSQQQRHCCGCDTLGGLQSGDRTAGFVCSSSSFSRCQKRFYPNLPALLSQMGNTAGFIPWWFCPYPLCFGAEWTLCSTCELWPVKALPPSLSLSIHPSCSGFPQLQLGTSKRWFSALAQPGCLCQAVSRSLRPLTWPHGNNSG